jgi:hypothetical protein
MILSDREVRAAIQRKCHAENMNVPFSFSALKGGPKTAARNKPRERG